MNNPTKQKMKYLIVTLISVASLTSCVSTKKFKQEQARYAELDSSYRAVQNDLKTCRDAQDESARKRALMETEAEGLNKQIAFLKENNNNMISQLKDLSVISSSQAESIKKSLENISSKDVYIQNLQSEMNRKDSLNMVLVMNLK